MMLKKICFDLANKTLPLVSLKKYLFHHIIHNEKQTLWDSLTA